MNFDYTLFRYAVILGPIFTIAGLVFYRFTPKNPNFFYAYRSPKALKSKENWDFAQKYASKLMIVLGILYTVIMSLLSNIKMDNFTAIIIGLGGMFLLKLIIYLVVEKKLNSLNKLKKVS